jgi:hypothetical protein
MVAAKRPVRKGRRDRRSRLQQTHGDALRPAKGEKTAIVFFLGLRAVYFSTSQPAWPAEGGTMALLVDEVKQRLAKLAARMDDMREYL